jgi:hypothetical protein
MPEERLKVHRFAAVLPEQLLTEASRHRDAVVPTDQRAVMRCLGDDLAALVHDASHSRIALSGSTSAVQRSTRGLHVCSYARISAQPINQDPMIAAYWDGLHDEGERTQRSPWPRRVKCRSQSDYQREVLERTGSNMTSA